MQFRSATADDVAALSALWDLCGLGSGPDVDAAEINERLREDDGFFVVGEIDSSIVAAVMGCYDNHRGWVKRVAVDPARHGHGFGRQIMAELERRFLEAGVSKLRLAVWNENEGGVAFWNAMQYTELPEIRYFTKDLLGAPDDGC